MKNLFSNKFLVVTIVISILLVGTTSFISALGYTSYVRNAIGIVLTPIQNGANHVLDGIESIFSSKEDYEALKKENEELKLTLKEQEDKLSEAMIALKENEKLKEFLKIKEEHNDFSFTDAVVTSRTSNKTPTILTIDKGLSHGLDVNMPVIDKYGFVGIVCETGLTWSKVKTIISPESSVGVYIERTGEVGIAGGSFSASKDGLFTVKYLNDNTDVQVGDRIFTSGDGSLFPKGLLVGVVESIEKDSLSREAIALVKPISPLSETTEVMIINEFEMKYELTNE